MEKDNIAWQNLTHKAPIIIFCHISNIRKKYLRKYLEILIQHSNVLLVI